MTFRAKKPYLYVVFSESHSSFYNIKVYHSTEWFILKYLMDSSSDIQVVEEMTSTEYTPVKTIETEVQGVSCQTMISNLAPSKYKDSSGISWYVPSWDILK